MDNQINRVFDPDPPDVLADRLRPVFAPWLTSATIPDDPPLQISEGRPDETSRSDNSSLNGKATRRD